MIIENITVIDPLKGTSEKKSLYISDGVFTADKEKKGNVVNGEGLYAAPGFKDIHVHCYAGETENGLMSDVIGINQGVTSVVDAGSSGVDTFKAFKENVIDKNITDTFFFLNIARKGLTGPKPSEELKDMNNLMSLEEFLNFKKENPENLVGIKVRMSRSVVGGNDVKPLIYAKEIASKAGLPLMVHIGNAPPKLGDVLNVLGKGDIVTHCFHGKHGGLTDYANEYISAVDRGVCFDIGHGKESFSINTVNKALAVKDTDFSISTDIYRANLESPVGSLMTTMSKFFTLGYTVNDLVRRVTVLPSMFINKDVNEIKEGNRADLSIFKIVDNDRIFMDSEKFSIRPEKRFEPVMTIKGGKVVWTVNA